MTAVGAFNPGLGAGLASSSPTTTVASSDCSNATAADAPTIFLFVIAAGLPIEGVNVSADGISGLTNSSGIMVIGGGNFSSFNVDYQNHSFYESLQGRQIPLICEGSSYYRVVSMSITNVSVPQEERS